MAEYNNRSNDAQRIKFLQNEVNKWRNVAQTDALTGIYNRGYFNQLIDDVVKLSGSEQLYCGLIMFDIDHFKTINDKYGHTTGDTVLRGVSGVVQGSIREDDVLARYGGEEFAITLISSSEISESKLEEIAEKIRVKVFELTFSSDGNNFGVTVSLGAGNYMHGESGDQFVGKVDRALYRAKAAGRNRVVVAE